MNTEIRERSIVIGTYDKIDWQAFEKDGLAIEDLRYHTSWNLLNPVWCKVREEVRKMVKSKAMTNRPSTENYRKIVARMIQNESRYHQAIDSNKVSDGFEVVVQMIKWLEENKK